MEKLGDFLTGKFMHFVLLVLVLINSSVLGMEAEPEIFEKYLPLAKQIDFVVLTLLVISVCLRLVVFHKDFFDYGWNTFDLVVVGAAVIGYNTDVPTLQLLRVLMVFRIIEFFPAMRMMVEALIYAFKGVVSSLVILAIVFYVFSIAGFYLFQNAPGGNFTSLGVSFASLFQLMLFDDFGNITKPITAVMPESWVFFLAFLFSTAFSFINLLIGVFVDAIDKVQKDIVNPKDMGTSAI